MAVDVACAANIAATKITATAYREIDFCHIISLGKNLLKTTDRRRILLREECFDVAFQVSHELFSTVAFELRCNLFFVTHKHSSPLSVHAQASSLARAVSCREDQRGTGSFPPSCCQVDV